MRIVAVTTTWPDARKPRLLAFLRSIRLGGHSIGLIVVSDYSLGGRRNVEQRSMEDLRSIGVDVHAVPYEIGFGRSAAIAARAVCGRTSSEVAVYRSAVLARRVRKLVCDMGADVVHVDRTRALQLVVGLDIPIVLDITDPRTIFCDQLASAGRLRPLTVAAVERSRARIDRRAAAREEAALRSLPRIFVASDAGRASLLVAGLRPEAVTTVPNAVSPDEKAEPNVMGDGPIRLVLSGNLAYPPNIFAVARLASEVVPAVRSGRQVSVGLVGSNPGSFVRRVVHRQGWNLAMDVASVPEALRWASIAVAPHVICGGFPNRILDAVYRSGMPLVASPAVAAGMPPSVRDLLPVADEPSEWRDRISDLVDDWNAVQERVRAAQSAIERECSIEAIHDRVMPVYEAAMSHPQVPPR